ncbi:MAG: MFS transporter, partial [Nocardioides sp.]
MGRPTDRPEPTSGPAAATSVGVRDLRRFYVATGISATGDGVLFAAVPLAAASLAQNAWQVGAISAATTAAWLVAGLPAGALVDRTSLLRVMVVADLARTAALLILAAALIAGQVSVWSLFLIVFMLGLGSCFFDPAAQALIPAFVGKDRRRLLTANGVFWTLITACGSLIGPPLGALLFTWSKPLPFLFDALSFLLSGALIVRISLPRTRSIRTRLPFRAAITNGIRQVWRRRPLRVAAIGMGAYNFGFGVANATLVLFALHDLRLSERQFGLV